MSQYAHLPIWRLGNKFQEAFQWNKNPYSFGTPPLKLWSVKHTHIHTTQFIYFPADFKQHMLQHLAVQQYNSIFSVPIPYSLTHSARSSLQLALCDENWKGVVWLEEKIKDVCVLFCFCFNFVIVHQKVLKEICGGFFTFTHTGDNSLNVGSYLYHVADFQKLWVLSSTGDF